MKMPIVARDASHRIARGAGCALLFASFVCALPANAQPASAEPASRQPVNTDTAFSLAGDLSGTLTLTSDYRFRGVSRTFGDPAVQGGAQFSLPSQFYFGAWGSNVDKTAFADSRGIELQTYGGYRWTVGEALRFDAGLDQYLYLGQSSLNTLEGYIRGTWKFFSLGYWHTFSNTYFGIADARGSNYFDLSVRYPIGSAWKAVGHYGAQRIEGEGTSYSDYLIGIERRWNDLDWSIAIVGSDSDFPVANSIGRQRDLGDQGLVLTVSKTF